MERPGQAGAGRGARKSDLLGSRTEKRITEAGPEAQAHAAHEPQGPFVSKKAYIERVCARMAAMPDVPQLPLWRAAADGVLALIYIFGPEVRWPEPQLRRIKRSRRPIVILIGADMGPDVPEVPPDKWRASWALRHWTQIAFVPGAAGHHDHYRLAVEAAGQLDRIAFVECSSDQIAAWARHLRCPQTNLFVPAGGVHPVAPRPESMQ